MSDLKPCPFCGGEPKYVRDHTTENIDEIICRGCWITVSDHAEQGSCVRAWNRRAKDAEIERLRARIAEMDEALHPFSEIAGEMFARNWELGRVVVALDNPDGANRVLFDDFLRARKALEG